MGCGSGIPCRNPLRNGMSRVKPAIELDEADRRILRVLQRDGRIT